MRLNNQKNLERIFLRWKIEIQIKVKKWDPLSSFILKNGKFKFKSKLKIWREYSCVHSYILLRHIICWLCIIFNYHCCFERGGILDKSKIYEVLCV